MTTKQSTKTLKIITESKHIKKTIKENIDRQTWWEILSQTWWEILKIHFFVSREKGLPAIAKSIIAMTFRSLAVDFAPMCKIHKMTVKRAAKLKRKASTIPARVPLMYPI